MTEITVGQFNTMKGSLLRDHDGLRNAANGADFLTLQETRHGRDDPKELHAAGYEPIAMSERFDLIIAMREGLEGARVVSVEEFALRNMGRIGTFFASRRDRGGLWEAAASRLRERGVLIAHLHIDNGDGQEPTELSLASAHPAIPLKEIERRAHVRTLGSVCAALGPVAIAGHDTNSAPGPRQFDVRARKAAGMHPVLSENRRERVNTFDFGQSRYPWLCHIMPRRMQLDNIWYKGVELVDKRIVPVKTSDHLGILATFRLLDISSPR